MPIEGLTLEQKLYSAPRYVTDDAVLRLSVFNAASGVTMRLSGRRLDGEGQVRPFVDRLVPTTNRVATTFDKRLDAGWLIGVTVGIGAGAPLDGQTYAILSIGRGEGVAFEETDVLAAGAVTAARRLSFPGSPVMGPLDGAGALRSIAGSTPAAGAEISETVPTGARWELIAFRAALTTSAVVAARKPALLLDDGTNTYIRLSVSSTQAASLALNYNWLEGQGTIVLDGSLDFLSPLPVNNRLGGGHRIRTSTATIQAADQWSAIQYLVREWIEGA